MKSFFDYNVRQKLGWNTDGTEYLNIDAMDPNFFTLDMFKADELISGQTSQNFVNYYGYDHTGKKLKSKASFDDFFTAKDDFGNLTRTVGAFQPIYMAGYLMDKFAFRDIVFNVGLRVDIFDANQPVLKDPWLFYSAKTVSEAKTEYANDNSMEFLSNIPDAMGDDYTVYVDDVNNPNAINGYRSGQVWYDADGIETEDPTIIRGAAGIQPWLLDPSQETPTADAFEDYKAQVNVMPRISFSFPISDEATLFANYDILTQRPSGENTLEPIDMIFITNHNNII